MENLIDHIKKFVPLSDSEMESLDQWFEPFHVRKKGYLLKEGEVCKGNYFVDKGCLRMFFIKDNGTEQITHFAIENWWLSDYMGLLTGSPSQFYIQAIEQSKIIQLNENAKEGLFRNIPIMERYFRLVNQRAYAASQLRIKYLYGLSREGLYHHFKTNFPGFIQRVPQYMIASYLGFTPEYLSELRKKEMQGPS